MPTRRLQVPGQYRNSIFLNFPYDDQFRDLFLAYVVGVCSFGLTPRTTLEILGGEQRLRRIALLIRSCRFSFHDLSRVELDAREPVLREISNALISAKRRPTIERMLGFLEQVRDGLSDIMRNAGAETPYSARVFSDLVVFTNELVKQQLAGST